MPAYAYPIKIEYVKKEIKKEIKIEVLPHMLDRSGHWTIDKIKSLVGSNPFFFLTEENYFGPTDYIVYIETRYETDEEQQKRIRSEEAYMEQYRIQKAKRELQLKERSDKIKQSGSK